jgi:hypothetical protein
MAPTDAELKAVFCEAADLPAGPDRDAYLDRVYPAGSPLRDRVAMLLRAHDDAGRFLGSSPARGRSPTPPPHRPPRLRRRLPSSVSR